MRRVGCREEGEEDGARSPQPSAFRHHRLRRCQTARGGGGGEVGGGEPARGGPRRGKPEAGCCGGRVPQTGPGGGKVGAWVDLGLL